MIILENSRIYYIFKCIPFWLDILCSQHNISYISTHLIWLCFDQNKLDDCYTLTMPCLFLLSLVLCLAMLLGMPFFLFSAYQGLSLKCSANVRLSRHYFCHPTDCNAFCFELFLWNTLMSLTYFRVIYKSHFSLWLSQCCLPFLQGLFNSNSYHEPTRSLWRFLKETQLLNESQTLESQNYTTTTERNSTII